MRDIDQYKSVAQNSTTPYLLVKLAFENIEQGLKKSIEDIKADNINSASRNIDKCIALLGALEEGIDENRGAEIAENLKSLYSFMRSHLLKAGAEKNIEMINDVIRVLDPIKDGWDKIPSEFHGVS